MGLLDFWKGRDKFSSLWKKCPACGEDLRIDSIPENLYVCEKCNHHLRMPIRARIKLIADEGSFVEINSNLKPVDPICFVDSKPYPQRISEAIKKNNTSEAAQSLGANAAQISSWLWALGIGIGVSGFLLSWKYRYPISTAWSTAGLALVIASAGHYSLGEAIGAFLISGILIACLGFFGIFERIFQFIPQSLTSAMLAGVLLKFGISVFGSLQQSWPFVLCVLAVYLVSKKLSMRYSIVITVLMAILLCPFFIDFTIPALNWSIAQPVWTTPEFSQLAFLLSSPLHTQLPKISALHTRLRILCFFYGIHARKKGFSAVPAEPRNR